MSDRPTPETDAAEIAYNQLKADEVDAAMGMFGVKPKYGTPNGWKVARKLERERDEAREALRDWQTLRLWGAEPQNIHDFIKGQQVRIHEAQDIEKTCEQLERERDELLAYLDAAHYATCNAELRKERDELREEVASLRLEAKYHDEADALRKLRERERDEAREALENHTASTIHTCHDKCKRPMCVLRRERDEAREYAAHYRACFFELRNRTVGHVDDTGFPWEEAVK